MYRTLTLPHELFHTVEVALNARSLQLKEAGDTTDYSPKLDKITGCMWDHGTKILKISMWSPDQLLEAAHRMDALGGHFARHIAQAFYNADNHNQKTLVSAFCDLFIKYGPGGPFDFKETSDAAA